MKDKKMIVVDLDGTLLNMNSECSKKSKNYLKKLKKASKTKSENKSY